MTPFTHAVDLRDVQTGEEFTVAFRLETIAFNGGFPTSWASAYTRDPLAADPGLQLASSGLTPTNAPRLPVPEPGGGPAGLSALAALGAACARRSARHRR